jgi:hypothetical protein
MVKRDPKAHPVKTSDGFIITEGAKLWIVQPVLILLEGTVADVNNPLNKYWDGVTFVIVDPETGAPPKIGKAEQLWREHPVTGKRVAE